MRKLVRTIFLLFVLLVLSSCVEKSEEAGTITFAYQSWILASVFLAGIAMGVIGWLMRTYRFGKALMVFCPIVVLFLAPTYFSTRATVTEEGFNVRMWGT